MSSAHPPGSAQRLAALALVLLPLLAACGGAAGSSPSTFDRVNPGIPAQGVMPTAAAAPAAAATSAPAAGAESPADSASGGSTAATAAPAAAGEPLPPERAPEQQAAPLKAGEVDDNAEFAAYLNYMRGFASAEVLPLDVSERYVLTVTDAQERPVLDATVRVFDGEQVVFTGRTYAGGKTVVFPRALGVADDVKTLRVQIEKGNSLVDGKLARGQDGTQSFVLADAAAPSETKLDVLFLLDATGSMSDEIYQVQRTIRSIAEQIDALTPRPALRFGLVAYRDYGDDYVTKTFDFTSDVEAFREALRDISADGGGDEPEALTEALHAAANELSWAEDAVRLTFLIADAPPHVRSAQQASYIDEIRATVARGVKIYPIAASNTPPQAEYIFRQMAQQTLGRFIFLTYQEGKTEGAPGETTQMNVDPEVFTVDRLDEIVVRAVKRELSEARGAE